MIFSVIRLSASRESPRVTKIRSRVSAEQDVVKRAEILAGNEVGFGIYRSNCLCKRA